MTSPQPLKFKLLPEWQITQKGSVLQISGGADAKYEIELENDRPSFFANLKHKSFSRNELALDDQPILEQLLTAEIIVPMLKKQRSIRVALLGDTKHFNLSSTDTIKVVKDGEYEVALVVRSTSTYATLLKDIKYQDIVKPHLFIDTAFHHTVSIGPLVFPGETACIACLQGRVGIRWDDDTPPNMPLVAKQYAALTSELAGMELHKLATGDTSLANKTVSWNLLNRSTRQDQLLKVPICPICIKNKIDQSGALALPWIDNDNNSNAV